MDAEALAQELDVSVDRVRTAPGNLERLSLIKRTEVKTYIAKGTLTLNGVDFFIEAYSLEEAQAKAAAGSYVHWELGGAKSTDWKIKVSSVEINE